MSENVRNELECLGRCNIEIANRPNENEMINLIIKKYQENWLKKKKSYQGRFY